jgi:hypothetical protein
MTGGRILTIGDPLISPSSSSHLKSCCSERYRVTANEDAVRSSSAAMNASTCSRLILAAGIGMAWRARDAARRAPSSVQERMVRGDRLDASK